MSETKTITEQIEEVCNEICDKYCKWPNEPIPEGKRDGWLIEDADSPCNKCPLNKLH